MKKLFIEIEGITDSDIDGALAEVMRRVPQGYQCGADQNDTGAYSFRIFTGKRRDLARIDADARLSELLDASEAALERLKASQPPKGGATARTCRELANAIKRAQTHKRIVA